MMNNEHREESADSSPPLHIIHRSQAIYGSLVETLGPYSRDYTTYFYNIRFYTYILSIYPSGVNDKKRTFFY
jgi:hypothetical protein